MRFNKKKRDLRVLLYEKVNFFSASLNNIC